MREPPPRPPVRRRPDVAGLLSLGLALPGLACSLLVTGLVGRLVLPGAPWLVPLGWFLSAAVLLVRPVELLLVRLVFGMRRPSPAELFRLADGWSAVCRAAGVDPRRYDLLVQDSHEPNAFAAGGRVVAVTGAALRLPPAHLEAVLAHELGHHLAAHPVVSTVSWWFALPARAAAFVLGRAFRFVIEVGRAGGGGLGVFAALLFALILLSALAFVSLWLILTPLLTPLLALATRLGELRADDTARALGYGPGLVHVLRAWDRPGHPAGWWRRLVATHPPHAERIARLER
ncbi:MAG TPA: M48 family metalloprotease [Actinophytocola sp.]|nr:M48 family metalloprotease [Actinophytocola sp.]